MAKKQSNLQLLSPEEYIRQRARKLPLYHCLLNRNWEESGLAFIRIAREHASGNITFCNYLVDLKCLGIKETHYGYNAFSEDYNSIVSKLLDKMNLEPVAYNLVHNIIYAGWEFAEEIGFRAAPDFLATTRYMLEEDTGDIPLIDIHCGDEDGLPLYVQGPHDTPLFVRTTLDHLERTLGANNYHYVLKDGVMNTAQTERDNSNRWKQLYDQKTIDELKQEFLETKAKVDEKEGNDFNEMIKLDILADLLFKRLTDERQVDSWLYRWSGLGISLEPQRYTPRMLGLPKDTKLTADEVQLLDDVLTGKVPTDQLLEHWGDLPFAHTIEIEFNWRNDLDKTFAKIDRCLERYPDYPLLKMLYYHAEIYQLRQVDRRMIDFEQYFKGRRRITNFEMMSYYILLSLYFSAMLDFNGMEALKQQIEELEDDQFYDMAIDHIQDTRISLLEIYFISEDGNLIR